MQEMLGRIKSLLAVVIPIFATSQHTHTILPYPERPELRKQHRDPSAEAAAGPVLLNVEVLQRRHFRCDGVHVFQSYGNTQRQPGHTGRNGGCVCSQRITTWEERK